MLRLGLWFAGFMAVGLAATARFDLELTTNAIAVGAGVLAILATGIGGGKRRQHPHQ